MGRKELNKRTKKSKRKKKKEKKKRPPPQKKKKNQPTTKAPSKSTGAVLRKARWFTLVGEEMAQEKGGLLTYDRLGRRGGGENAALPGGKDSPSSSHKMGRSASAEKNHRLGGWGGGGWGKVVKRRNSFLFTLHYYPSRAYMGKRYHKALLTKPSDLLYKDGKEHMRERKDLLSIDDCSSSAGGKWGRASAERNGNKGSAWQNWRAQRTSKSGTSSLWGNLQEPQQGYRARFVSFLYRLGY